MTPPLVGLGNSFAYTLSKPLEEKELIDTPRYFTNHQTQHELYATAMQQAEKFLNQPSELENKVESTYKTFPLSLHKPQLKQPIYNTQIPSTDTVYNQAA